MLEQQSVVGDSLTYISPLQCTGPICQQAMGELQCSCDELSESLLMTEPEMATI